MSSGTDKIVSSIMSEAQDKADKIIQDAQAEVDKINAKATKDADAEKNKILENGKKQSDMRYQQIISEAKMNARRAELEAKEDVIEAAFNKATEELSQKASSNDAQYTESLINMIKEAAIEIGGGELIVKVKDSDKGTVSGKLSAIAMDVTNDTGVQTTLTLGEPIDVIGGAVLITANGDIEVNNTIESRLDRNKKILRSEVASVLFNL
ncbi:MAG: V-type proton ATPase subunit E [Methanobrevibacter sp.]|uniref:V-type proton ATPase subunit E n=1 Tax=Methanobrevibacter sp. TaxID=66852 RepID=UPI0026DEC982|nr:V-type proton ATPase subunit E [Methanobrevibacter sp.]MDO5848911.1 V-type proton ATPase subunit E [Methanobrevibacter sp.]